MLKLRLDICLLYVLLLCSATSDPQHLVCKTVQDVFTEDVDSGSSSRVRRHQGPPGKKGPPGIQGIQGIPGPPGSPATVDYDQIDDVIAAKVELVLTDIKSRMSEMEANITTLWTKAAQCESLGGHYSRQKCFTIPHISSSEDMNYDEAVSECAKHGALLAEIHDRQQQDELHDFALTKKPAGRNYVYIWVGMEYQSSTSQLLYRSDKRIPTSRLQWDTSYPLSSHKYLILEVGNDGDSSVGLWNYFKSRNVHGVLCEKDI